MDTSLSLMAGRPLQLLLIKIPNVPFTVAQVPLSRPAGPGHTRSRLALDGYADTHGVDVEVGHSVPDRLQSFERRVSLSLSVPEAQGEGCCVLLSEERRSW